MDRLAVNDAVRAGKIQVLENTQAGSPAPTVISDRLELSRDVYIDYLTGFYIPDKGGAHAVQRTGLRGKNPGVPPLADTQGDGTPMGPGRQ